MISIFNESKLGGKKSSYLTLSSSSSLKDELEDLDKKANRL